MQENLQNIVSDLLSDDNGKQVIKSILTTLSESPDKQDEKSSNRQSEFKKNIALINNLMPFLPQKNIKKAHLLIKILEVAMLFDEIKAQGDN